MGTFPLLHRHFLKIQTIHFQVFTLKSTPLHSRTVQQPLSSSYSCRNNHHNFVAMLPKSNLRHLQPSHVHLHFCVHLNLQRQSNFSLHYRLQRIDQLVVDLSTTAFICHLHCRGVPLLVKNTKRFQNSENSKFNFINRKH